VNLSKPLIVLFLITISLPVLSFDKKYKTEGEIPEPLLFDLVRRINSDKGELEVNTLFIQHSASEVKDLEIAPEIEFAFADGKAIEIELPTAQGKIQTFKTALQFQLPSWIGDITGTQILYEKQNGDSYQELTPLLLIAKRLNQDWSTLMMLGSQIVFNKGENNFDLPILNLNFFYDFADVFDLGFEINQKGIGSSYEETILMPQIHALLKDDFKIQAGFGVHYDGYRASPVSAFRLIKEFNHGR
jgi:hypothetical protein